MKVLWFQFSVVCLRANLDLSEVAGKNIVNELCGYSLWWIKKFLPVPGDVSYWPT